MLGCFVVTIALVMITMPRNLPVDIALDLTLGVHHVLSAGGLIHGVRTYRAVKTVAIVYASGANALARGLVRMRRPGFCKLGSKNMLTNSSVDGLIVRNVDTGSATFLRRANRNRGPGNMKGPARMTLLL